MRPQHSKRAMCAAAVVAMACDGLAAPVVSGGQPVELLAVPFPLSSIQIPKGSLFDVVRTRNLDFQLSLNDSQLLCEFTSAANLTSCSKTDGSACATPGMATAPQCNPLPGEMGPGGYYGHYQGHWLSGTAMMYNSTGDQRVKDKSAAIVSALADVQQAWSAVPGATGYLFPYGPNVFDMIETRCGYPGPKVDYSVPYYTLHKIMAGLLDQYQFAANAQAFSMVTAIADWVVQRVSKTLSRGGQELWQCVLGTEWGGMNEVLYNLYAITGKENYRRTGLHFNHWQWTAPLAAGLDDLGGDFGNTWGNHANTHIPEIIGSARGYELSSNTTQKAIAENFFKFLLANHSWATGGSNDGEHWAAPARMGDQLNADTEESCTQYNVLKVSRHLFQWSADSKLGDFYERALMNGIIGNQNRLDPTVTSFIYMLPLGAPAHKPWAKSNAGFPCCWGTLTEQFSKLTDSIYFASPDQTTIFVQQFVSSTIHWPEKKAVINQTAGFPYASDSTTTLTITIVEPTTFTIKLRVPSWAAGQVSLTVNGNAVEATPGTYATITREWNDGDIVDAFFEMTLWTSAVEDTRPAFNSTYAFMFGPLVLAGLTDTNTFIPDGSSEHPSSFITRQTTHALNFTARGGTIAGGKTPLSMIPLFEVMEEEYCVYFRTTGQSDVRYAPGGALVPSASSADWQFSNAGTASTRMSDATLDLRTAGPNLKSTLTIVHPIVGEGHSIDKVSLSFQYVAGFDSGDGAWPIVSVVLLDALDGKVVKALWKSPPLDKYQFDKFTGYSPPIFMNTSGLTVSNDEPLFVSLVVDNNARNLQIPLISSTGLNVHVEWTPSSPRFTHSQFFHHH